MTAFDVHAMFVFGRRRLQLLPVPSFVELNSWDDRPITRFIRALSGGMEAQIIRRAFSAYPKHQEGWASPVRKMSIAHVDIQETYRRTQHIKVIKEALTRYIIGFKKHMVSEDCSSSANDTDSAQEILAKIL